MSLIDEIIQKKGKSLFILIDPGKQTPKVAAERAKTCEEYGADAIMIGGSTNKNITVVDETVTAIKNVVKIPIIQFPNTADIISKYVDYIFFMSLFNAMDSRWIMGEQVKAAPIIKKYGIKPISMCYLIVNMSKKKTTVEQLVKLDRITSEDIEKTKNYVWVAKNMWGMSCIYLEAGSGSEKPIPDEMITAVKNYVKIPLIVGGGIMDAETAKKKVNAGADILVVGTLIEKKGCEEVRNIIKAIK